MEWDEEGKRKGLTMVDLARIQTLTHAALSDQHCPQALLHTRQREEEDGEEEAAPSSSPAQRYEAVQPSPGDRAF